MLPTARVVHQLHGRIRLRITGAGDDSAYFEIVRQSLQGLSGVDQVRVNAQTGSALILHAGASNESLRKQLAEIELFEFTDQAAERVTALEYLRTGASSLNQMLSQLTAGHGDLRAVAFLVLVGLAIRQALRGKILTPAITLLWIAMELVGRSNPERNP